MASLFDIGKSGLQSYQQALSVTGQNIANINSDGYKRREASLQEVLSGKSGVTGVSDQTGLGVRVESIRRSFDEFLLNKARAATADFEKADTFSANVGQIENLLLPGEANLGSAIGDFFNSLQEIVNSPSDLSARSVALEKGRMLADTFVQTSNLISQTRDGILKDIERRTIDVNILTSEMANLNQQIASSGGKNVNNSLLDKRDLLLDKISALVGVSITLSSKGVAKVSLGPSGNGPLLVNATSSRKLTVSEGAEGLIFATQSPSGVVPTTQVASGAIQGLAEAYSTTSGVVAEIDNLAFRLAHDLNQTHKQGLDLEGNAGKDLFRVANFTLTGSGSNLGDVTASVKVNDFDLIENTSITLTFNDNDKVWNARSRSGDIIASGKSRVSLPGVTISFDGVANDFDQFIFDPSRGNAANMAFGLSRPQEFAASSPKLISADANNPSDATFEVSGSGASEPSGLPEIASVFSNNLTASAATKFINEGPVAVIPANVNSVDILSLIKQSDVQFNLSNTDVGSASSLSVVIRSTDTNNVTTSDTVTFSLNKSNFNTDVANWEDMSEIAKLLNIGALTGSISSTGSSVTLAELGGFASGEEGNLTLSLSKDSFASGKITLGAGGIKTGVVSERIEDASSVRILTREGRQIAGAAIDPANLQSWQEKISAGPPFKEGAVYNDDYLNLSGSSGYMGVEIASVFTDDDILLEVTNGATSGSVIFDFLEGVDTDEGSPNGLTAVASSAEYTANFGSLSATVGPSDIAGTTGSDVAKAMVAKMRSSAPSSYIYGKSSVAQPFSFTLGDIGLTEAGIHSSGQVSATYDGNIYKFVSDGTNITVSVGNDKILDVSYDSSQTKITGKLVKMPADGDSVLVNFEGQNYKIEMRGEEVFVTGGEEGRLSASYGKDYKLKISSNGGSVSKSNIGIVTDAESLGNMDAAVRFGLASGGITPTTYYSNQPWIGISSKDGGDSAEGGETIQLELVGAGAGAGDDLTLTTAALSAGDDDEIATAIKTAFDNLADKKGYSAEVLDDVVWFSRDDGVNFATTFTEGGVVGTTAIDLTANIWPTTAVDLTTGVASPATTVGFSYTAQTFHLVRSGAKVEGVAIGDDAPPAVSATATSLAKQRMVLSNLPDEELIVVVGSTGARSVTLQYDELPVDAPTIDHDVTVKVVDAATRTVEFIDTETGTSRATRILDNDGIAEALSLRIDLNGQFANGDLFYIADNGDGIGDGRTLLKILDAQSSSIDGSGGFQNTFNIMVSRLGARVESGNLARDAAESLRDASVTAEAAYTGVNLDTEASNLIQQQQAYQASARILSTARELFNTLLDMV